MADNANNTEVADNAVAADAPEPISAEAVSPLDESAVDGLFSPQFEELLESVETLESVPFQELPEDDIAEIFGDFSKDDAAQIRADEQLARAMSADNTAAADRTTAPSAPSPECTPRPPETPRQPTTPPWTTPAPAAAGADNTAAADNAAGDNDRWAMFGNRIPATPLPANQ